MKVFDIFSTVLVNRFGRSTIRKIVEILFAVSLVFFISTSLFDLLGFIRIINLDVGPGRDIFLSLCEVIVAFFVPGLFGAIILESYNCSHCTMCSRDLANEIIDVRESENAVNRVIQVTRITTYQCRYCGHLTVKAYPPDKYGDTPP